MRTSVSFALHPEKINTTIYLYKQHVQKLVNTSSTGDVIQGKELDDIFSLNNGRIIISADKNLGCTIMEIEHYRQQHDLINSQQHFGRVELDGDLYIYCLGT